MKYKNWVNFKVFLLQDIPPEEELLVWYGQNSVYHMGLPLTSHNTGEGMQFLYFIPRAARKLLRHSFLFLWKNI